MKQLKTSKKFFIQKAIGWALREYAKTTPDVVWKYVQTNELAPLSKREAIKHIQYLYGIKNKKQAKLYHRDHRSSIVI